MEQSRNTQDLSILSWLDQNRTYWDDYEQTLCEHKTSYGTNVTGVACSHAWWQKSMEKQLETK